jgi:hypothetical protein
VTVTAQDTFNNTVTGYSGTVHFTSSDGAAILPVNSTLTSGTGTFTVTLKMSGNRTVTATDMVTGSITGSGAIAVNPGSFAQLQLLVPGETASPGSATGKTGSPSSQAAGIPLSVTVNAVDALWNLVNTVTDVIHVDSSDAAATLPPDAALAEGTKSFIVTLNTAGTATITASDTLNLGVGSVTSPSITVGPGTFTAATGGGSISADTAVTGVFTSLTGPVYSERSSGDAGAGTIILTAPAGFIFDTSATPRVLITRTAGNGTISRNINGLASGTTVNLTATTTTLTFNVTSASGNGVTCSLTWQNVKVRPIAGTPLATGHLAFGGTATLLGVSPTSNLGTLTEIAGAAKNLAMVTEPSAVAAINTPFVQQPAVQVKDQFGNDRVSDNSTSVTAVRGAGTGTLSGTTTRNASSGVVAFTDLQHDTASTITINFTGAGLNPLASGPVEVTSVAQNDWRSTHFSSNDLTDRSKESSVWGDLADPDGDGRVNLMEYALGMDPSTGGDAGHGIQAGTVTVSGSTYNTLTFNHRLTDPALSYVVEVSSDQQAWDTAGVTLTSTPFDANFNTITAQDGTAIPAVGARFIRLRVIKN